MGMIITARLICDKCNVNQVDLNSPDDPVPDQWMKDQGYANISGGASAALIGYYCPTCLAQFGTRELCKNTCDICEDLTPTPEPIPG